MAARQTVTLADKISIEGIITLNDTERIPFASIAFDDDFDPKSRIVEVCKAKAEGDDQRFDITLRTPGQVQGIKLPRMPWRRAAFSRKAAFNLTHFPIVRLGFLGIGLGFLLILLIRAC